MNDDPILDEDMKRIRDACEVLSEHYDTVQIFVTRHDAGGVGGTVSATWGSGNWFARHGQVREWLVKDDELVRIKVRRDNE